MDDNTLSFVFTMIFLAIAIFTFIGCSFALTLFYYERKRRKIAHNFIIGLCISDIVHGCIGCSICIRFCNGSKVGHTVCPIEWGILMATVYISLMNVLVTSIDRCWAILFPFHYQANMNEKLSYVLISLGWIIGLGLGLGVIGMRSDGYLQSSDDKCIFVGLVVGPIYLFGYLELIIYVTVTLTLILYIAIYIAMRKVFRSNICQSSSNIRIIIGWINEQKRLKMEGKSHKKVIGFLKVREVRVTLLMFLTIITFVSCWIPCMLIIQFWGTEPNTGYGKLLITYALPKAYSMINPIFYVYTIQNFRKASKIVVSSACCRSIELSSNSGSAFTT